MQVVGVVVISNIQLRESGARHHLCNAESLHVVEPSIAAVFQRMVGVQWSVGRAGRFKASEDVLFSDEQCYTSF